MGKLGTFSKFPSFPPFNLHASRVELAKEELVPDFEGGSKSVAIHYSWQTGKTCADMVLEKCRGPHFLGSASGSDFDC